MLSADIGSPLALAIAAVVLLGILTTMSALSRWATKRFRGSTYRETVEHNPPGALLNLYGRGLPALARAFAVGCVLLAVALLVEVLTSR